LGSILLSKTISLSDAVIALNITDLDYSDIVNRLLSHAVDDDFNIYFDGEIRGYSVDGPVLDRSAGRDDLPVSLAPDLSDDNGAEFIKSMSGKAAFIKGYCKGNEESGYSIGVSEFEQIGVVYKSVSLETETFVPTTLSIDCFYLNRSDFEGYIQSINIKTNPARLDSESSGAMKALALLAREIADKKVAFKSGNKVNASAFKDHLLVLADKHEISSHGLMSLDDEINKTLKKLDLKDIPESKIS
jgi:hypothetical protein